MCQIKKTNPMKLFSFLFQGKCRPLFCPSGFLLLRSDCLSNYRLFGGNYMIYVELRLINPTKPLSSSVIQTFVESDLKRPHLQNWRCFIMITKTWTEKETLFVIAILQQSFQDVLLRNVLEYVKKSFSIPWQLHFANQTFDMSAKFHRYIAYRETSLLKTDYISTLTPAVAPSVDTLESLFAEHYHHIILRSHWEEWLNLLFAKQWLMITKLSFCNLIELEDFEYIDRVEQITLTATNVTLAPGEFQRALGYNGQMRPRICLEDLYSTATLSMQIKGHLFYKGFLCCLLYSVFTNII